MSVPMKPNDPAYWMLQKGLKEAEDDPENYNWRSKTTVYDKDCYICNDPEFSLMGLPLCRECCACKNNDRGLGHVPADDDRCSICEHTCNPWNPECDFYEK